MKKHFLSSSGKSKRSFLELGIFHLLVQRINQLRGTSKNDETRRKEAARTARDNQKKDNQKDNQPK